MGVDKCLNVNQVVSLDDEDDDNDGMAPVCNDVLTSYLCLLYTRNDMTSPHSIHAQFI